MQLFWTDMYPQSELDNYKLQVDLLQDKLKRSEENRQQLEQELKQILLKRSEHDKKVRAKSRQKYEEFLDEQQRRNERNRNLVQTLERIDHQAASLQARSERLKAMKLQYEKFFGRLMHSQTLHYSHALPAAAPPTAAAAPIAVYLPTTPAASTPSLNQKEQTGIATSAASPAPTATYQIGANLLPTAAATTGVSVQPVAAALTAPRYWTLAAATPTTAGILLTSTPAGTAAVAPPEYYANYLPYPTALSYMPLQQQTLLLQQPPPQMPGTSANTAFDENIEQQQTNRTSDNSNGDAAAAATTRHGSIAAPATAHAHPQQQQQRETQLSGATSSSLASPLKFYKLPKELTDAYLYSTPTPATAADAHADDELDATLTHAADESQSATTTLNNNDDADEDDNDDDTSNAADKFDSSNAVKYDEPTWQRQTKTSARTKAAADDNSAIAAAAANNNNNGDNKQQAQNGALAGELRTNSAAAAAVVTPADDSATNQFTKSGVSIAGAAGAMRATTTILPMPATVTATTTSPTTAQMSMEKIENAIYGELVNPPLAAVKPIAEGFFEDLVKEPVTAATTNAAQQQQQQKQQQLEQQRQEENVLQESAQLQQPSQDGTLNEAPADYANYANYPTTEDTTNNSASYSQDASDAYDPSYAPIEGTTEAQVYQQQPSSTEGDYTTEAANTDYAQYGATDTDAANAGAQQDYSNVDYSNYDATQYNNYDPNAYPGYTYDEATGQYTADGTQQQYDEQAYAANAEQYDATQANANYDYSSYAPVEPNADDVTSGTDANAAAAASDTAYETTAAVAGAAETAAENVPPATVDDNTLNVGDTADSNGAMELPPAEPAPARGATKQPTSILATNASSAANDAHKKKKRVNFVDSSETDDSSSAKVAVAAANVGGGDGVASSESDFDFSNSVGKSGA